MSDASCSGQCDVFRKSSQSGNVYYCVFGASSLVELHVTARPYQLLLVAILLQSAVALAVSSKRKS